MRWGVTALSCVMSVACGARTGLSDGRVEDAAVVDVTFVAHDAAPDVATDAPQEAQACCDMGIKLSGCQTCAAGEKCWDKVGACLQPVLNCGPSNCAGCCESPTMCADGRESGSCGSQGQACQTCFDAQNKYATCVPNATGGGGTCVGGPTCTPKNCLTGCCNGDVCMLGDVDTLCGYGGIVCVDCGASSGYCDGGVCANPHQ